MIYEDMTVPGEREWTLPLKRITLSFHIDLTTWALPVAVAASPVTVKAPSPFDEHRFWVVALNIGPFVFGVSW